MEQAIFYATTHFPMITSFFTILGMIRLINKPLFALLHYLVVLTPFKKDDVYLNKVERSKAYLAFCFFLDWMTSIKLNPKR